MPPRPSKTASPETTAGIETVEKAVRAALSEGRAFAAYDLASTELNAGVDIDLLHLLAATALVRSGAVDAARDEIAHTAIGTNETSDLAANSKEGLLLAELLEELWQASAMESDRQQALSIRLRRAQTNSSFTDLARAALLTQAGNDRTEAQILARAALKRAKTTPEGTRDRLLDQAELSFIVGDETEAALLLERLAAQLADHPLQRAEARRLLDGLPAKGIAVDPAFIGLFELPVLVVFAGLRPQLQSAAGIPTGLEKPLATAIDSQLNELKPAIAYGSAAAGCDLLFGDALLARGTELNIVLPFQRDSFRDRLVAPYGAKWLDLFDRVIAGAAHVIEVCQEQYFGDDALLHFGNQVIDGKARLRGATLSSPPYLVAVWDYLADPFPGSPDDFIDHWGDPGRLRLIGLDEVGRQIDADQPVSTEQAPTHPTRSEEALDKIGNHQRVASLLFADVVGFSRLTDDQLPLFWRFMNAVAVHMGDIKSLPSMINNWGDAIFTVHNKAMQAAEYAIALSDAFRTIDSRQFGLPERLKLRTGLHAGPIFEGHHPLTEQRVAYGGNVNRAARIEPITVPGHVYASEQFVAVLTAEDSAQEAEVHLSGNAYRPRFRCIYRGCLELAKDYGTQAVYEVEPWSDHARTEATIDPGKRLHIVLANELDEHQRLATLFKQMTAPLSLPDDITGLFELAFDEIVTNICSYAWPDEGRHSIDVEIVVHDGRIEATFSDDGEAFDPLSAAPANPDLKIDERSAGGLGIHLVNELMDDLRYRRDGNLNRLTVVKQLTEMAHNHES